MTKKQIQLPKEYLSYSQIQVWKNDRKRYIELYFNDRHEFRLHNAGLEYGKIVADALEKGVDTGDILTDAATLLLPKYDTRDQEIRSEITSKDGYFFIIGRPDTFNSETKAFREYKTGKGKWTQKRADRHPQLVFYAMLIYLKHGVLPPEIHLDWIETFDPGDGIKPTGRVESFQIYISLSQVLDCMAETIKIAKEIELAWVSHVKPPDEVF